MDGESLKKVDNFKYLGSLISKDGAMDKELNRRIQLGSALYSCVKDLIWNTHVPLKCKKTIFQTYYLVQAAEMRFLRSMIGKTRRDRIRNEIIRSRIGVDRLQDRIETSRLKWYGHVRRMNEERLPNKYLEMKMEGRRKQGRPRLRWKDIINRDIVKRNQNPSLIERNQTFRDRMWWQGFVNSRPINHNRTT
ncbi:hypothetical protein WDU94_003703 [Cyamophila willieti]